MNSTSNFEKHTSKNPIQKFLISNFYKNLLLLVKKTEPKTIVDVGCGEGFTLNEISKLNITNKPLGVDYSKQAITLGKKLYPNLDLRVGDIYKLSFKSNSFDLVVCTEVLEHLEKPQVALEELIRISKKHIILSVPNEPFFMAANFLRGKDISRFGNNPEHINHWGALGFRKFLEDRNLEIAGVRRPFPWTIILCKKIGRVGSRRD